MFTRISSVLCATCASVALADGVMTVSSTSFTATTESDAAREFTVEVNLSGFVDAVGAQATIGYDPAVVEYVGIAAGTDFPELIYSTNDTVASTITFATGVSASNPGAGIADGNVAHVTFRTIAPSCADADPVFLTTGAIPSHVTDSTGASLPYTNEANISITSLGPFSLEGVPADASVAADAGTTAGSLQSFVSPTATDSCGNPLTVEFSRSDSGAAGDYYPVGVTTITYSATDSAGNTSSAAVTVTVADHQLLDAELSLVGSITGSSVRSIRIKAGATTSIVDVAMTDGAGVAAGIQVPVAAEYTCASAKDTGHSITASGAATVSGVRYAASFALVQGDSNNDDFVDILDFGMYVGDFGVAAAGDTSNFNDDDAVNVGDYSFIALNFAHAGSSCGAFTGGAPRTAVSIKQLRREGLGFLAGSDLNRDGMLDVNDIVYYMQHGIPPRRPDVPATPW